MMLHLSSPQESVNDVEVTVQSEFSKARLVFDSRIRRRLLRIELEVCVALY